MAMEIPLLEKEPEPMPEAEDIEASPRHLGARLRSGPAPVLPRRYAFFQSQKQSWRQEGIGSTNM